LHRKRHSATRRYIAKIYSEKFTLNFEKNLIQGLMVAIPLLAITGLNHHTETTTGFIRIAEILALIALSGHLISNRDTTRTQPP
jgi:hypothetical protein